MMPVFVDTCFYLAIISESDSLHSKAYEVGVQLSSPMVTTSWVLTEVADALSAPIQRPVFLDLLNDLRSDENLSIISADNFWFEAGLDIFRTHQDKYWSLTDCISIAVMQHLGLKEVLTADRHFVQAGFRTLLL